MVDVPRLVVVEFVSDSEEDEDGEIDEEDEEDEDCNGNPWSAQNLK